MVLLTPGHGLTVTRPRRFGADSAWFADCDIAGLILTRISTPRRMTCSARRSKCGETTCRRSAPTGVGWRIYQIGTGPGGKTATAPVIFGKRQWRRQARAALGLCAAPTAARAATVEASVG